MFLPPTSTTNTFQDSFLRKMQLEKKKKKGLQVIEERLKGIKGKLFKSEFV